MHASLMIAAGVNAKALSTYVAHANISITLDCYGHLMPGNEVQAARLHAYLDAATCSGRSWGHLTQWPSSPASRRRIC
jgi:integrase